jgi:hypothetical protein
VGLLLRVLGLASIGLVSLLAYRLLRPNRAQLNPALSA